MTMAITLIAIIITAVLPASYQHHDTPVGINDSILFIVMMVIVVISMNSVIELSSSSSLAAASVAAIMQHRYRNQHQQPLLLLSPSGPLTHDCLDGRLITVGQ